MADPCGAKTRAGGLCKAPAMANGRCRVHGGKSTGPKNQAGNTNAKTHGIYSRFLSDDERYVWLQIEIGRIDDELRLTRIRLMRALQAESEAQAKPELDEIVERDGAENVTARREEKYKRRDYVAIIDRLTGRIESLEKTRAELRRDEPPPPDGTGQAGADYTLSPDEGLPANPIL